MRITSQQVGNGFTSHFIASSLPYGGALPSSQQLVRSFQSCYRHYRLVPDLGIQALANLNRYLLPSGRLHSLVPVPLGRFVLLARISCE
jgi:hypothetical protein